VDLQEKNICYELLISEAGRWILNFIIYYAPNYIHLKFIILTVTKRKKEEWVYLI
jgi:hypothetical protein